MYARTAFRFENDTSVCPFLSELDEEESIAQTKEEVEIKNEMPNQHNVAEAVFVGSMAGVLAGAIVGNIIAIFTGGSSKALLSELIAGIVSGVVAALGLGKYIYENDSFARNGAINKLEITRYRAIRLDDKVNRITKKLLGKGLSLHDERQSWKARFFFQETLTKYQGVRASGSKDDQSTHEAESAKSTERSPALQKKNDEARTIQQSDASVQTEPVHGGAAAISPEQGAELREQQNARFTQEKVESVISSKAAEKMPKASEDELIPTCVECVDESLKAAAPSCQVSKEIAREVLSTTVTYDVQPTTEDEGSASQQFRLIIAQINELQKRSPKLGLRLKSLLEREGVKSGLLQNILYLANPSRMLEQFGQGMANSFRDKNGKARTLVNRLAGIGGASRLVSSLKGKIEQGYDLFYDKNKRVFSDAEDAKLENLHSLLFMLSKQPVGVMHSDLNFGVNFAQIMKSLTKDELEILNELIDLRWPRGLAPIHIELLKEHCKSKSSEMIEATSGEPQLQGLVGTSLYIPPHYIKADLQTCETGQSKLRHSRKI